ncbi:zonadhesin-like [Argopecten irradians]|uniref:zonadhesin-like n=1 Tax=Argopecten irradians TaxID=31199 RepID=UPI00370FFC8D
MEMFVYTLLWVVGHYTVSSQPLITTKPLTTRRGQTPDLSGSKQRHHVLLSNRLTPTPPPPAPMAPLISNSVFKPDLSMDKKRTPIKNKQVINQRPDDRNTLPAMNTDPGTNGPIQPPVDPIQVPNDPPKKPLDQGQIPNDPVINPSNPQQSPMNPPSVRSQEGVPTDPGMGAGNPNQGPIDPPTVPKDPSRGHVDVGKEPSVPNPVIEPPPKESTVIDQTTTAAPPVVTQGCPEYSSSYRRDRLYILYNNERCEIEVRLKRHKRNRGEFMSVRFRKTNQPKNKTKIKKEPVTCEEFPVDEHGGITSILTRPDQCKLELSVELAPMPTSRTRRKNKRGKRFHIDFRRPKYSPVAL